MWINPLRVNRELLSDYYVLLPQLTDAEYRKFLRVTRDQFEEILSFIDKDITKQYSPFRSPISPGEKLAVCLRLVPMINIRTRTRNHKAHYY